MHYCVAIGHRNYGWLYECMTCRKPTDINVCVCVLQEYGAILSRSLLTVTNSLTMSNYILRSYAEFPLL